MKSFALSLAGAAGLCAASSALAQAEPVLADVEVRARGAAATPEARAAQAVQAARDELSQRAGGTAVIDAASYAAGRASTAADALAYAPGVLAQTRHGPETRLSIRGSGVQRGYLMRGIQLYQDGIPLNQADGAADFQSIDPMAAQHVEVWRGANALEYGASSLGGAINFVSPTGLTAPAASLRLQAGSFGQRQAQAQLAGRGERVDGLLNFSRSEQDGWREQSAWRTQRLSGNVGLQLTDTLELRAFLSHVDADMQMPGSLTRAAMLANPRQAAPGYVAQDAGNNYRQTRGALRMDWQPREGLRWTTSLFAAQRDRFHPMTMGIVQQDMRDTGLDSRLVAELGQGGGLTRRLVLGFSSAQLDGDEWRYTNAGGAAGTSTGRTRVKAHQDVVYGEYSHGLSTRWTLQAGLQFVRAQRRQDNLLAPASSYDVDFSHTSPKLGLLFAATPTSQWYANISGSFEAPPIGELVYQPSLPLGRAQSATTVEAGWRGHGEALAWDAAIYHSRVRRELLALTDASGAALGTTNADRTIHQGLELSMQARLAPRWSLRTQYLYSDLRFDNDAVYGRRRLAGIPPHLLRAELQWKATQQVTVAPGLEWLPSRTWVDHANTVASDGYALLNLRLSGTLGDGWSWFVEGRNLTDRRYAATTAVQANVRGVDGAYYFPGDGRAVYAGLSWRMP